MSGERFAKRLPERIEDLLSDEEREALQADLREIAATRRRAWALGKDLVLGAASDGERHDD